MSSSLIAVRDDGRMSSPRPRSQGPTSKRSLFSAQKLDHLAAYESTLENGQVGPGRELIGDVSPARRSLVRGCSQKAYGREQTKPGARPVPGATMTAPTDHVQWAVAAVLATLVAAVAATPQQAPAP